MPIYEYVCQQCGNEFELFVRSITAAGQERCPACASNHITKRLSTFATNTAGGPTAASSGASCAGPV